MAFVSKKGKFRADEMELAQGDGNPAKFSRMGKQSFYEPARKTSAKFVILTTYDTDNEIYGAIKAGAKGYLLKDEHREVLLESIRKVSRGETCIPPERVEKVVAGMRSEALTSRELEVLALLVRGRSNKEITAKFFISKTTVNGHLRSIFTKLNVLSRTETTTTALRRGLVQL